MELILNLVWVCVAIAGVCVQLFTATRAAESAGRVNRSRKILAMLCALVILFFVISMTDDLHDQEVMLEESRSSGVAMGARISDGSGHDRLVSSLLLEMVRPASLAPPQLVWNRFLKHEDFRPVLARVREGWFGRAPPPALV